MTDNAIEPHDCDVLIVGAGPVGQVLALLLAQQGLRVSVVERWARPYPLPRAVAINHDVLRVLRQLGLGEELSVMLEPSGQAGNRMSFQDEPGQTLVESHIPLESESGFAQMSGFSQPDLEQLLERRVQADPLIDQYRGFSLEQLSEDGAGISATIRPLLGVEMTDLGFNRDWLVVDVVPHTAPSWLPYACQRLGPARPTTLVPAGPGRRRWEFMMLPTDDQDSIDTNENAWSLLKPWDIHPGNADLVRHALYTFRGRWADQWHRGRTILAGDAAHQMPPFLGQGFNSGIRDAANLAWRLALLVRRKGRNSLLDDYAAERSAQVRQIVEETVAIGRMICMTDPDQTALRDVELKRLGTQGIQQMHRNWPLRGGTLRDDGGGRNLGLQCVVGTRTRVTPLDDVIAPPSFVLLGRDRDPVELLSPTQRAAWRQLRGRSAHFGPGGLADAELKYAPWFERLNASVVLVRPDFQVFGGVLNPHTTDDLVDDLADRVLA